MEKRKAIRLSATLEVSIREIENDQLIGSMGKNMSETGICIPLPSFPTKDALLEIEIRALDSRTSVFAIARVAWVVALDKGKFPFEAGLQFLNLRAEDRETLHGYIARCTAPGGAEGIRWTI